MLRSPRKILIPVGVAFALILLVLVLVPFLFEDRIAARAQAAIERAVDAQVDWQGTNLTFFRDFPHLTLSLGSFTVAGVGRFEADTLVSVSSLRLVLDVGSVLFGDQTVIRSVDLDSPALRLIVLEDGTANWDIMRSPDAAPAGGEAGREFNVGLRRLTVRDGRVVFDNRQAGLFASLEGLDHTLRGDFARDRFIIGTQTYSDAVTVRSAGIPWLAGVTLDVDADIDADRTNRTFTFGDNTVRLNDLILAFTGSVRGEGDDVELDVAFASPQNDFRSLLSLVPAIWSAEFASLQTEGELSVTGRVTGRYGERTFPAFSVLAQVDRASFQYPDLPLPARDIFLDLAIANPGGDADSTVVSVRRLHARIGEDAIDATLTLRTPVSDPDIDLAVEGVLDLAAAGRTFRLEGVDQLAGVVNGDFAVRARRSAVISKRYDRIAAGGEVVARDVSLRGPVLRHDVAVDEFALGISPRAAELRALRATIGSSDLRVTGSIDNLLGFAIGEGELSGRARLESNRFDLDEWRTDDSLAVILVPPRVDFVLRTAIAQLHHGRLDMTDARGVVRVKDQRLTIDSLRLNAVGGEFNLSGHYETIDPARPTFDVAVGITGASVAESSEALTTVRLFAPVAGYAEGRYSTSLRLAGALGENMMPILTALSGRGTLETTQVALQQFPPMDRLADALQSRLLRNPALRAIRTAIDIDDGRLHVRPFDVGIGATTLTAGGSNGLDRSLDYDLVLALPQSALESAAREAVGNLFARAGDAGAVLDTASVVRVAVRLTGTVDDPSIGLDVGRGVTTAVESLQQATEEVVERAARAAAARADSASAEARRRAEAEAQRILDGAERQAASIRAEARGLAESVRSEANQQADSLVARATNPVARLAAERAAERLRREADERADQIIAGADSRADAIVAEARQRAAAVIGSAEQPDTANIERSERTPPDPAASESGNGRQARSANARRPDGGPIQPPAS